MENVNKDKVNLINGKNKNGNIGHNFALNQFKNLLQKIKAYKDKPEGEKPKKFLLLQTQMRVCFVGILVIVRARWEWV